MSVSPWDHVDPLPPVLAPCCWRTYQAARTVGWVEGAQAERDARDAEWAVYAAEVARGMARSIDVENARARAAGRPPVHGGIGGAE